MFNVAPSGSTEGIDFCIAKIIGIQECLKLTGVYGQKRKEQLQNFAAELNRKSSESILRPKTGPKHLINYENI